MLLTTVRHSRQKAVRRAGFTLLEVLVVVAILVILATVASISIFRYMEDAKMGRAKADMQTIEQAVKKYYTENFQWPPDNNLIVIAPYLEQGENGLLDPWSNPYKLEIRTEDDIDGSYKSRPIITCQPGNGRPAFQWPMQGR